MAIRQIAKMGHPVLRKKAAPVDDPTDPDIAHLAADMRDTLEWIGAAGVAAPQVYDSRRVVVYRILADRIPPGVALEPLPWTVMVNPVITPLSEEVGLIWERCLSLPGLHGKVPRYKKIEITHLTLGRGKPAKGRRGLARDASSTRMRPPGRHSLSDADDRSLVPGLQRRTGRACQRSRDEAGPGSRAPRHGRGVARAGEVARFMTSCLPA